MKGKRIIPLATITLLVLVSLTLAQSQLPTSKSNTMARSSREYPGYHQNPTTQATVQTDKNVASRKTEEKITENTEEPDDKDSTDWWLVKFTAALAFFALAQVVAMIFQYCAMRKQVRHLRESVEAAKETTEDFKKSIAEAMRSATAMENIANSMSQNVARMKEMAIYQKSVSQMQLRAYLSVHPGQGVRQDREFGQKYVVQMVVKNTGHTPAHEVIFAIRTKVMPYPLPNGTDLSLAENPTSTVGHVPSGQQFFITAVLEEIISEEQVAEITRGDNQKLYVFGTIWYKDAFGEDRYTNFCHFAWWNKEGKFGTSFTPKHNEAT